MKQCFAFFVFLVAIAGVTWAQDVPSDIAASPAATRSEATTQVVDPLGVWEWEQRFGGRSQAIQIRLVVESGELAGTYHVPQRNGETGFGRRSGFNEPVPLSKIKLVGDKISFEVTRKFGENESTTNFAGVLAGDEIAGVTVSSFGGQVRESAWMAQRRPEASSETAEPNSGPVPPKESASEVRAQEQIVSNAISTVSNTLRLPEAGQPTDQPYEPRAILPGGIVLPLYPADSSHINQERIKEPEKYNLSDSVHGRINGIVNIHNPSIEVHFASPSMNTGSVVILAAGGGHRTLNVGSESADFVPYFFNFGVNTVILRNRLRSDGYEPTKDAVRDALQAVRLVRKHATQWKIDPNRIGIMGFSAGAELSAPAAILFAQFDHDNRDSADPLAGISSRPDFVGIIYPGPTPFTREPETEVPRNTPPAFIACAGSGDRVHAMWATDYLSAMLKAGIPNVEMHIYGNGYHPGDRGSSGGLTHRKGIPFGTWQQRFIEWFDDLGFLADAGIETKAAKDSQEFVNQPPQRPFRKGPGQNPSGPPSP